MAQDLTVGQIASTLDSAPSGMITRARLEDISQNGIPGWQASMLGVTAAQAQSVARDALEITDARFNGDVNAAMVWLRQNGNNPEYSGLTVDQASARLGQPAPAAASPAAGTAVADATAPEAAEVNPAAGAAAPVATAAAAAGTAAATETAAAATPNQNIEGMRRIMDMFNDGSFAQAFESGDWTQIFEMFMTALTGETFSMSNDPEAFAGATSPDGTLVPAGSQIDPATGNVVADPDPAVAAAADPARDTAPPQQAVAGMTA